MLRRTFTRSVLILAASLATGPQAAATFIAIDLPGGSPDEVTRDTATGLDWLDPVETAGIAFLDAVSVATASFGSGWRHATAADLCVLFAAYGLDPQCSGTPPSGFVNDFIAPHTENDLLFAMLGATVSTSVGENVYGLHDDENPATLNVGGAGLSRPLAGARIFATGAGVNTGTWLAPVIALTATRGPQAATCRNAERKVPTASGAWTTATALPRP